MSDSPDRRRLGRGLGALIQAPQSLTREPASGPLQDVRLEQIQPNPLQPRREFADDELRDLADSLRESGLLQPVTVRRRPDGHFELIAGERRLRAAKRLGWTTIPAYVRDASNEQMLSLALVENLQRTDLNPIEEAEGYRQLVNEFGLSHQDVAQAVGKERSTVSNALRLLALPEDVLHMVRRGDLSLGHARALLALPDDEAIVATAQAVVQQKLSVRDVERLAQESRSEPRRARPRGEAKSPPTSAPEVTRIADRLRRYLQTDVSVQADEKARGEIRIRFYSADDLDRLLDLIIGPTSDAD
jgi:ParB family chromosome partitioning protein